MRVAQSLLSIVVYGVFAVAHEVEVALGLADAGLVRSLSVFSIAGSLVFHALVRSGSNRRWTDGTALTQAQCLFGVLCATLAYAVNGETRGAVMSIGLVILVFGMFALQPAEARGVGALSLLMLGAVMAWTSHDDPSNREPAVELVHFLFASIGVATVLVLAGRLGRMRSALAAQKLQLEDVLQRLQQVAMRDELTGLYNRRHMNTCFEAELSRLERVNGEMAVVLLDIDFFKQVNDRLGHHAGDGVLRHFAKAASEGLRATDVLARWGGEEFLLLMPMTSLAMAVRAIDRLRCSLRSDSAHPLHGIPCVTFSAGVAMYRPGDSVQSMTERADRAMYRAKRDGRDRTVTCSELDGDGTPAGDATPPVSAPGLGIASLAPGSTYALADRP